MFQKEGSSTIGGKKDVPLRKSDRRRLRDRVLDTLFTGGGGNNNTNSTNNNNGNGEIASSDTDNRASKEEWIARAEKLVDDAIVGGDVLSRKLRLLSGENATLYLRTASSGEVDSTAAAPAAAAKSKDALSYEEVVKTYPTSWPYRQSTQPALMEYEDADRKVHLVPLLPLLAALPPPLSSPPLEHSAGPTPAENNSESAAADARGNNNDDDNESAERRQYRIPNVVVHSEVSKFTCRGADLMKSGIRSFPSPWTLRQSKGLVTVSVIGNPQPVAVGTIEKTLFKQYCYSKNNGKSKLSSSSSSSGSSEDYWKAEAANLVGPGKKGVAVSIVNCYGDDLWKTSLPPRKGSAASAAKVGGVANPLGGGVYDDGHFGNEGFVDGARVYPILEMGSEDDDDDDDDESSSDENEGNDENDAGAEEDGADVTAGMDQLHLSNENEGDSTVEEASAQQPADNASQEEEANNINASAEEETPQQPVDNDEILQKAFYASLLILLMSKTPLPIPVSIYYAKHLLAAVDATGPRLEMKQTTYKKIGPFLKEMESDGVIKLGASKDGKDKCAFLADIVKTNPELIQFKREWKKELEANGGASIASMGASAADQKTKMAVVDLFIVPRHVADGMELDRDAVMATNAKTEERKGTGFLTKKECGLLIESYIEKEGLKGGKGRVLLNGPLCDALYKQSKKSKQPAQTTADYPTSVKRKELIEKWIEKMEKGHAVVQMPGSKILHLGRGGPKTVDIEVEFRQGNKRKFLTRLRGMEEYGVDGESLSQDVSQRFACSSSVETAPVGRPALKKGRVELVFQGHLSEELTALLTGDEKLTSHGGSKGGEYNLPRSVINVMLRKGVTARKKR